MQINLKADFIPFGLYCFLTAREQKAKGPGTVIFSLTLHVPQTELRENLSSRVSLVLALGINSVTHKRTGRGFADSVKGNAA